MKRSFLLIALSAAIFSSCATILTGSTQDVTFSAEEGTKIYKQGVRVTEIPSGKTTSTVNLQKNISSQQMVAKKDGHADTYFTLRSKVNGIVFLNILLGGVVGGAIDCATGAACKYDNYVEIDLEK